MTKQYEAIYNLTLAQNHLRFAEQLIKESNPEDGTEQFDYVTSPKLASMVDAILATTKNINKIVYQK